MVTDSNELLGQALGTCTLQRLLGRGGMGAVYLAQQSRPRRTVAVKVLLPGLVDQRPRSEFLARFRREADAIASLDHVNIMPVYEYGEQGETAYLVMPYVAGGTLRDVLEKRGKLSMEEVIPIIEQIAAGLDSAHSQGIVHRDLKPGNILFHNDGRVLIADFGLAKVIKEVSDQEASNGHLTSIGTIVGTPEYLSPEQGTGIALDHRTDVYSLGVMLYQMLAGRVPFTGTSPVAVAIKHAIEQPPLLTRFNPSIPKNVEAVVMKAIQKAPNDRYNSAGEFALALHEEVAKAMGGTIPHTTYEPNFKFSTVKHTTPAFLDTPPPSEEKITTDNNNPTTQGEQETERAHRPGKEEIIPSMSTMLMPSDTENLHSFATEVAPKLNIGTGDAIVEDHATIVATNEAQTVLEPPPSPPIMPNRPVITERPLQNVSMQQGATAYPPPPPYTYPPNQRPAHKNRASLWMLLIGVLVVVIVAGSVVSILLHGNSGHPTNNVSGSGTSVTQSTTPRAHATNASTTQATASWVNLNQTAVPPGVTNVGEKIYGTNTPGTCDNEGGSWKATAGTQVSCTSDTSATISSLDSAGGVFLNQIPGQSSFPGNYVIQVDATITRYVTGSFGIYFRNTDMHQGAYAFIYNGNTTVSAMLYDNQSGIGSLYPGTTPATVGAPNGTLTLDVVVTNGSFSLYVNGQYEYNFSYQSDGYTSGNVGLEVGQGANVTFKDFELYTA